MEPIKKIAGKILLYFYYIQRDDYASLHDFALSFQIRHLPDGVKSPLINNKDQEITQNLIKISGSDNNIYNGLMYLYEKGFINMSKQPDNTCDHILNITVSSIGIDIVEGIERGEEEKREFNINFNIKLADNINIESLIKAELGSLIKASLI